MKTKYVLPEGDRERIENCQNQIGKIRQSYIDEYLNQPFQRIDLERQFRSDIRVQTLEKEIARIYEMSVGKYIFIAENEEEKKILEKHVVGGWGR